ncbi:STAS domain-containing protein [Thiomicrorhabdus sp. ZW0627]|uniref:STAS domain-containing protein n=1 Tax=Thiomicrorhabdus sp. ZW0627 TaxID=3039774 RepID=UPI0024372E99|nr:STAS domain-containing protein [Thiomicrorhabdus sp. ZW0627]MDG6773130.1 STAS domain-containing protein [Thiomicrorhabdus sp. ZW0627]
MGVECKVLNHDVIISIIGSFDVSCYDAFNDSYKAYLSSVDNVFTIDMRETTYLDSSALGMLLLLRERTGGDRKRVKIMNVTEPVMEILKMAHFDQLFVIESVQGG